MTANPSSEQLTIPALPPVVGDIETWDTVIGSFSDRLERAGFEVADVPAPESPEFPKFLADVNENDPLLAAEISRKLRSFRDRGNLPSSSAAARRERRRKVKQSVIMRREGKGFVYDKRKAPLYGLAALFFILGPFMYFLSRPPLKAAEAKNPPGSTTTPHEDGNAAPRQAKTRQTEQKSDEPVTLTNPLTGQPVTSLPTPLATTSRHRGTAPVGGNDNLDAFAREQSRQTPLAPIPVTSIPKTSNTTPVAVQPPVVTPPPVAANIPSSPSSAPSSSASNVYRPVPVNNTAPSFGNSIPVERTAPVASSTASVVTPTEPTPAPPLPVTRTTDNGNGSADSSFGSNSGSGVAVRPTSSMSSPGTASSSTGQRRVTPPSPAASAPPVTASTVRSSPAFGDSINQAAPSSLGNLNMPTVAASVPERPVTSGLTYQRRRPETPQQAVAPVAAAPAPANTTPAPGEGLSFGALGSAEKGVESSTQTAPAETPFGSSATNQASRLGALGPFKNLQQVPARLVTAVFALTGGSVPVVVVTPDGGSFVGVGTINGQLGRVDMQFRRYIDAGGQVFEIDALAYSVEGNNLTQGVAARIEPIAPTLALDAAQNGVSALQGAVQSSLNAMTSNAPKIAIGDNATIASHALPPLWQILAGGVSQTFTLPKAAQSITRAARVDSNTPMVLILGIGAQ